MTHVSRTIAVFAASLAVTAWLSACSTASAPRLAPAANAGMPEQTKEQMAGLAREHKTAWDLYQALKDKANGGQRLTSANLPDWSGVYTRAPVPGFAFDPDQPPGGLPTAKLTPEFQAKMLKRIERRRRGIEWDPISTCAPPGHPRWLTEPFLREFIVTPDQTWLINEMVNDIRRIYTDGRDHVPEADRYPLYNGDSIGFWDGDRLGDSHQPAEGRHLPAVAAGLHGPGRDRRDLAEGRRQTMARRRVGLRSAGAAEPWYTSSSPTQSSTDPDKSLRIRYWNCGENENNTVVYQTQGRRDASSGASPSTKKESTRERSHDEDVRSQSC